MQDTLATMIDVAALEERSRGREPHAIDLVVDRRFLLDVRVARRNVGFRLVVVVVADEVLDRVLRKEAAEFLEELRGQGLVVRHHQRRPVHARDGLGHRVGLARPGHAEQHLMLVAAVQSFDQLRHGAHLVATELEVGDEVEAIVKGRHSGAGAIADRTTAVQRYGASAPFLSSADLSKRLIARATA